MRDEAFETGTWRDSKGASTKRRLVFLAVVGLFVLGAAVYVGWRQRALAAGSVTLANGDVIAVEVAATAWSRERGLAGRDALPPGEGMLFQFPSKDRYSFWMKDMRFPIDIVWLEEGQVVDIMSDVPVPPSAGPFEVYQPLAPVDQVLELAAGEAVTRGIRLGDSLTVAVDSIEAGR